jgi:TolB-like protein
VDFDHGINNAIKRLREALGDTAETPLYIETLPRRGYRFVHGTTSTALETSIAVLPFLSLSADPENEIFADGMCEEIICALMQIKSLRVVARTSSFAFKGKHLDLREIAEQLNVKSVLEGSVRRSGNNLRITAQLVNAAGGYHLWSEKYDREMKDVFAVQEDIAQAIARRLELTLDADQQPLLRAGTNNLEAFKSYMQGRALFFQRGVRLLPAVERLKKAVSLDPNYALAWSALADALNMVPFYGLAHPAVYLQPAKEAALKAIALDPSLAEAHNSLAVSRLFCNWDIESAGQEFLRSLELKPRYSLALTWYGVYYLQWLAGRFEEGLAQATQAVESDPLSAYARAMQAFAYLPIDLGKSLETVQETFRIDPESYLGWWAHLTALKASGHFGEAAQIGEAALKVSGRSVWVLSSLAQTYARLGKSADAEALYNELQWRSRREYVAPAPMTWAASATGRREEAIRYAQEAVTINDPSFLVARYWPDFEELRQDPCFQKILVDRGWT